MTLRVHIVTTFGRPLPPLIHLLGFSKELIFAQRLSCGQNLADLAQKQTSLTSKTEKPLRVLSAINLSLSSISKNSFFFYKLELKSPKNLVRTKCIPTQKWVILLNLRMALDPDAISVCTQTHV